MVPTPTEYSPLAVAIALSLYGYNVSPHERAQKLYDHFKGACAEVDELADILVRHCGYEATTLAQPTARVYVQHALDRYGQEACSRIYAENFAEKLRKHGHH